MQLELSALRLHKSQCSSHYIISYKLSFKIKLGGDEDYLASFSEQEPQNINILMHPWQRFLHGKASLSALVRMSPVARKSPYACMCQPPSSSISLLHEL